MASKSIAVCTSEKKQTKKINVGDVHVLKRTTALLVMPTAAKIHIDR